MRAIATVVVAAIAGALAACGPSLAFECGSSSECSSGGAAGTCQPTGFCSFADATCPSGERYGDYAGDLSGECVGANGPDAGPGGDASNLVEVSFGETGNTTFSGVTFDTSLQDAGGAGGADLHVSVDQVYVGLYRFDVTAIPQGVTIVSASIELSTINDANLLGAGKAQVFRVLETWDEATATYTNRNAEQLWTNVNVEAPGSRDPEPLGEFAPTVDGRFAVSVPPGLVEEWVANPEGNAGLLVDAAEGAVGHLHLGSKEGEAQYAAVLKVAYLP